MISAILATPKQAVNTFKSGFSLGAGAVTLVDGKAHLHDAWFNGSAVGAIDQKLRCELANLPAIDAHGGEGGYHVRYKRHITKAHHGNVVWHCQTTGAGLGHDTQSQEVRAAKNSLGIGCFGQDPRHGFATAFEGA